MASGLASPVSSVCLDLRCCLASLCSADRLGWRRHWMPSLRVPVSVRKNGTITRSYLASDDSSLPLLRSVILAALLSL